MKSFIITIISLLLFLNCFSQSEGELSVSFTTSDSGGPYRPSHVMAIWVEDENGNFVKTLKAYASTFIIHLNIWKESTVAANTPFNTVDAITGPTVINHTTRTCTWDGKDYNLNPVADGTYKLRMELTDKNATGNYSSFSFEKNSTNFTLNPEDVPSFSDINIIWQAENNSNLTDIQRSKPVVFPNPSYGIINIQSEQQYFVEIRNINGQLIAAENSTLIDIKEYPAGVYFLKISLGNQVFNYKVFKRD